MRTIRLALMVGATMALANIDARAENHPRAVPGDARIRSVAFDKDNVVQIFGTRGVSTMLVFGEDERVATIAIGDSVGWQAVPDQSKRFLFVKPLEPDARTNMNVVTNKRIYNFVLIGTAAPQRVVFKVRFTYPDEEYSARLIEKARAMSQPASIHQIMSQPNVNYDYSYKGHVTEKPGLAFDDGVKTYFKFNGQVPGIYRVNTDMTETLINYRREGEFIVVDEVGGQWTMRNGGSTACVFNLRAVKEPAPKRNETDVQPDVQTVHAEPDLLTRVFGTPAGAN